MGLLGGRTVYQGEFSRENIPKNTLKSDLSNDKHNPLPNAKSGLNETLATAKEETNGLAVGKL